MNKKVLLSLLYVLNIFCADSQRAKIVDYDASYQNAIMDIIFQDPHNFFAGSAVIEKRLMDKESFMTENKKGIQASLNNANKHKKVMMVSEKVAGFVVYYIFKEQSLESLMPLIKKNLQVQELTSVDKDTMLASIPDCYKKTDAECEFLAKIESLAVDKDFRRKGFARALIKESLENIKYLKPTVKKVQLDVNEDNVNARKLYESEGFKALTNQPIHMQAMRVIQYEKELT